MTALDPELCYRAVKSRDARFDGRFYTAVHTTGIYCRPICPARTPLLKNVSFYRCAAAASAAGFRPCLRCRPESAPGSAAWEGTSAVVARALRLIERGALDQGSVELLGSRVGLSGRHLRRLFEQHLGASPLQIAQGRRLAFARKLLDETALPMSEVAFAAGFSSVRRFNGALKQSYGFSPRQLRAKKSRGSRTTVRLGYRAPFDWGRLIAFLSPRALAGVETISEAAYSRFARLKDQTVHVKVQPEPGALRVEAEGLKGPLSGLALLELVERVRALFDLSADPMAISACLEDDPLLVRKVACAPGLRVPGAFDGFEVAVRALLGQQVRVAHASKLAARLIERLGEAAGEAGRLFPAPDRIAQASLTELVGLGLPEQRARALQQLAAAVVEGLDLGRAASAEEATQALLQIPGIGPWTAQYIAMRVFSEPDAFPCTDLVLRQRSGLSASALKARAEAWRPWRAYAAMYIWSV